MGRSDGGEIRVTIRTSSWMGSSASAYFWVRSSSVETSRAVAATLSPRSSAAIAHSRPKPRDVPVMNQTFPLMWGYKPLAAPPFPD